MTRRLSLSLRLALNLPWIVPLARGGKESVGNVPKSSTTTNGLSADAMPC